MRASGRFATIRMFASSGAGALSRSPNSPRLSSRTSWNSTSPSSPTTAPSSPSRTGAPMLSPLPPARSVCVRRPWWLSVRGRVFSHVMPTSSSWTTTWTCEPQSPPRKLVRTYAGPSLSSSPDVSRGHPCSASARTSRHQPVTPTQRWR